MPWRTTCPMDERLQFLGEWLQAHERRAVLCERYGISRMTGYRLAARYEREGAGALQERSRAPHRQALAVGPAVAEAVLRARAAHPRWGPRKLRVWLGERHPAARWPAPSTIGALLQRHGLTIARRGRPASVPPPTAPGPAPQPNDRWTADFKGWFRTGDGARCLPFTLADYASRYLLRCQLVPAPAEGPVRPLFEAAFREYGLPRAILTDNGPPFVTTGVAGLSRLAVWWIKLGIQPERIAPAHPEQNPRHERMHRTLAEETAQPPQRTARAQQRCLHTFRQMFNQERPHEALGQRPPARVYAPSPRPYPERLPEPVYAAATDVRRVRHNGEVRWRNGLVFLSQALAGELVGLEELIEDCWRVRFGPLTLGWIDGRHPPSGRPGCRTRAAAHLKLSPMCPV